MQINAMHSVSLELDHRVSSSISVKRMDSAGAGKGSTRMGIDRARSAERFRMGCKRGNGDKLVATLCAPPRRANNTSSW